MSNKRCIPITFHRDPHTALLSKNALVLFLALIVSADDEGRGYAHAEILSRKCGLDFTADEAEAALQEIAAAQGIVLYQDRRQRYYAFTDWSEYRGPGRPTRSYHPAPPAPTGEVGTVTHREG